VIALVWQFEIEEGKADEFEKFYGAGGPWAEIARRDRAYLGASFLRNLGEPLRYMMTEYWSEMLVYETHHHLFESDFELLEKQRNALVKSVTPVGVFQALDVPVRTGPTWSTRKHAKS
jgi:hypothetical protein